MYNFILILFIALAINSHTIAQSNNDTNMMWKGEKLKKNEVEQLIKHFNGVTDKSILDSLPLDLLSGEELYKLSDGRIVLKLEKGNGVLYKSLDDIREVFAVDHTANIPKIDESFLTKIPELIEKLGKSLNLSLTIEDRLGNLEKIDSVIRKRGIMSVNEEEYLLPMVAYCGQVIVNEIGGIWEVTRENKGEPRLIIKGADGKIYDPYNTVLSEIADSSEDFSFAGIVHQQIKPFKLKKLGGRDE